MNTKINERTDKNYEIHLLTMLKKAQAADASKKDEAFKIFAEACSWTNSGNYVAFWLCFDQLDYL